MTDLTPVYRIAGLGILVAVLNIFLVQADRKEQASDVESCGSDNRSFVAGADGCTAL